MKYGMDWLSRLLRLLIPGFLGLFLWKFTEVLLEGIRLGYWNALALLLCVPFLCIGLHAWLYAAPGELTAEGVYVQWFFRKWFYPWQSIRQALVLISNSREAEYHLILVTKFGSPRKAGEPNQTFRLRNPFSLIYIPAESEAIEYITAHYGPLDCDQRNWDREHM